jgi:hypothetical protein
MDLNKYSFLKITTSIDNLRTNPDYDNIGNDIYPDEANSTTTAVIESVLLHLPLPVIYVYDETNHNKTLIKPDMVIETILGFVRGKFPLVDCKLFPNNERFYYKDLEAVHKRRLLNAELRVIIIDNPVVRKHLQSFLK